MPEEERVSKVEDKEEYKSKQPEDTPEVAEQKRRHAEMYSYDKFRFELLPWFRDVQVLSKSNQGFAVEKIRTLAEFLVYAERA